MGLARRLPRPVQADAQDTCFGGRVVDFVKNSSAIYQQAPADSVAQLIDEEGVTLMTFFAHAAGGRFDINIDNPANYAWNGKHPMIIGNSCVQATSTCCRRTAPVRSSCSCRERARSRSWRPWTSV